MIRKGRSEDMGAILTLIKELAVFEKAEDEVNVDSMYMEKAFTMKPQAFDFFVYEKDQSIIGLALFYYRYSTWKGRRLYLEDLIISKNYRGKGLGEKLLSTVVEYAKETDCSGVMWQVLDWNKSAIDFYEAKFAARLDSEWVNCHIDFP